MDRLVNTVTAQDRANHDPRNGVAPVVGTQIWQRPDGTYFSREPEIDHWNGAPDMLPLPDDPGKPWTEGDTLHISLPDELPLVALKELVRAGEIMAVVTFEDHMRPDVSWIAPTEYREAFEEITDGVRAMRDEAAFTQKPTGLPHDYPGFINARLGPDGTTMEITVRGDQPAAVLGDYDSIQPGKQTTLIISLADFDQWIADVQRVRSGA